MEKCFAACMMALAATSAVSGTVLYQHDFETDSSDWAASLNGNAKFARVTDASAPSGGYVAMFSGASDYTPSFVRIPISGSASLNKLHIRAYYKFDNDFGGTAKSNYKHQTLISVRNSGNERQELRYGQFNEAIGINKGDSDDYMYDTAGASVAGGAWHCVEVAFDRAAAVDTLTTYVDGAQLSKLTGGWGNKKEGDDWLSVGEGAAVDYFQSVGFGYQKFGGDRYFSSYYIDSIVIADEYIGCGSTSTAAPTTTAPTTAAPTTSTTTAPTTTAPTTAAPTTSTTTAPTSSNGGGNVIVSSATTFSAAGMTLFGALAVAIATLF